MYLSETIRFKYHGIHKVYMMDVDEIVDDDAECQGECALCPFGPDDVPINWNCRV